MLRDESLRALSLRDRDSPGEGDHVFTCAACFSFSLIAEADFHRCREELRFVGVLKFSFSFVSLVERGVDKFALLGEVRLFLGELLADRLKSFCSVIPIFQPIYLL